MALAGLNRAAIYLSAHAADYKWVKELEAIEHLEASVRRLEAADGTCVDDRAAHD